MIVFGMLLFFLKKIKGEFSLLLIEYFENWKDIVVFLKGYRCFILKIEDMIKLCYIVNLYVKLEEMNGEFVFDFFELKYRENLFSEVEEKFKIIERSYVCYFEVLVEVLKIFIY